MTIGIHQPNYLPYLGFFDKVKKSDLFVILDDAQFSKGDFHNRNRIKTSNGSKWITIPVSEAFKPINRTKINNELRFGRLIWSDYHLSLFKENYRKAPSFDFLFPKLQEIYSQHYECLSEINILLIRFICTLFEIETPVCYSSELKLKANSTQRLIDICEHFKADVYLSGQDGPKYMDMSLFEKRHIEVEIQNFVHPVYNQLFDGFVPYLSAMDFLFNAESLPLKR